MEKHRRRAGDSNRNGLVGVGRMAGLEALHGPDGTTGLLLGNDLALDFITDYTPLHRNPWIISAEVTVGQHL